MSSRLTWQDTGSGLAEAAILSQPWLTASSLPDVLARPAVVATTSELPKAIERKIVIRKRGVSGPTEMAVSGIWPAWFLKSAGAVVDLLNLPAGWNSYGAKPIAPKNAIATIRLLAGILSADTPPPLVVPRVRGGIQLEWHSGDVDIEVYVDSPDKTSFFAEHVETGETFEGQIEGNEAVLKAWLQRMSGK